MTMVKAGDVLQEAQPFCLLLLDKNKGKNCDFCFRHMSKPKRCVGCRQMFYCSKECASGDWKMAHKFMECKVLQESNILVMLRSLQRPLCENAVNYATNVKFIIRLVLKKQLDPNYSKKVKMADGTEIGFEDLTHYDDLTAQRWTLVGPLLLVAKTILGRVGVQVNLTQLWQVHCMLREHTLPVTPYVFGNNRLPIGRGIYITKIFAHSCCANTDRVYDGTKLCIRAIRDFDSASEPPTACLVSVIEFRAVRLYELASLYGQDCDCERCEENIEFPDEDFMLELYRNASNTKLVEKLRHFVEDTRKVVRGGHSSQVLYSIQHAIMLLKVKKLHKAAQEFERDLEVTAKVLYGDNGWEKVKDEHEIYTVASWMMNARKLSGHCN